MTFLGFLAPHAHWFLRAALASVFLYHGLGKFGAPEGLSQMLGVPVLAVYLLGTLESIGGVFILAGGIGREWLTRVAGAIFAVAMVGAIVTVHWPNGWNSLGNLGMEFPITLLAISLYFLARGNGGVPATTPDSSDR